MEAYYSGFMAEGTSRSIRSLDVETKLRKTAASAARIGPKLQEGGEEGSTSNNKVKVKRIPLPPIF